MGSSPAILIAGVRTVSTPTSLALLRIVRGLCIGRIRTRAWYLRVFSAAGLGVRFNVTSLLQLVLAISDYQFVRGNTACDFTKVPLCHRNIHVAHFDGFIGLHDVNVIALRTALDSGGRNHSYILLRLQQQVNIHKLIWPQAVRLILEDRF